MVARNRGAASLRSAFAFTSLIAELLRRLGEHDVREEPQDIVGLEPDILFGQSDSLTVAMREHGKLIIPLSVPEIVDLLLSKDEGADPNSYLFERVDQFLMGLGR